MAAAEGKSIGRIVTCQAVLGFNLVSEVPGCDPCGGERNQIFFQLLFAGFLGLEAKAINLPRMYEQEAGVPVPRGGPSANTLLPRQGCCGTVRSAAGRVEPQDVQYQVESKGMEAKKMQAFIWVVQPAFLPSSGKECSQKQYGGPRLSSCLPVCEIHTFFSKATPVAEI